MEKQAKVPKLRFPGFTGEWEERKLGDICEEFRSGKFTKAADVYEVGKYPVYGGNGMRGYTDSYNHDGIYTIIGRQGAWCGNVRISTGKAYFTEHAIAAKANMENDTDFLYQLLGKLNLGQYSDQSAQPGLAVNKLIQLKVIAPNKEEQRIIGGFLGRYDSVIRLHQRKLTHLQEKKKSLLQKMFPKKGERFPELRFPGFTGGWKLRRLGDIAKVSDSARVPNSLWTEEGVPYLRSSDLSNNGLCGDLYISYDSYNMYARKTGAPHKGDVLFTSGGQVGIAFLKNDENPVYVQGGAVLYVKTSISDVLDGSYLKTYFESPAMIDYLASASVGGTIQHFTLKPANLLPIPVPILSEQQKIGAFFGAFDDLIALHQRKLSHLKKQKQALLQQMFV